MDDVFRKKLRDLEKLPPEEVWTNISSHLGKGKNIIHRDFLWKVAAGIAILLTIGLGFYYLSTKTLNDKVITADQINIQELPNKATEISQINNEKDDQIVEPAHPVTSSIETEKTPLKAHGKLSPRKEKVIPAGEGKEGNYETKDWSIEIYRISSFPVLVFFSDNIKPPAAKEEIIPRKDYSPQVIPGIQAYELSEEEQYEREEFRQWLVAAMAAPEFSYRTIKDGAMAASKYFNNSEIPVMTYSGGLQIGYQLTKRLNLQSGFLFSRSGIEVRSLSAYDAFELTNLFNSQNIKRNTYLNVENSIGNIVPDNPNLTYLSYNNKENLPISKNSFNMITINLNGSADMPNPVDGGLIQYFDFIEFPFNLRYRIFDGLINLNLLGGLSSNFLIGNKVIFQSNGDKKEIGTTENVKVLNYSGNVGLSFDYEVSDRFVFLIEPRYKYYLHSINKESLINAKPYMIGIFTGISYKF